MTTEGPPSSSISPPSTHSSSSSTFLPPSDLSLPSISSPPSPSPLPSTPSPSPIISTPSTISTSTPTSTSSPHGSSPPSSPSTPSASSPSSSSSPSGPVISGQWQQEWQQAQDTVTENVREISRAGQPRLQILRVNQLDAVKLDQEINEVLKMQFMKVFTFMKPDFVDKYQPELTALMQFLIYRYSIFTLGTTYGNLLQNLKFRNEFSSSPSPLQGSQENPNTNSLSTIQKILYGVLTIGGEWAWARVNRISVNSGWGDLPMEDWRKRAWIWMERIDNAYKLLSILNFCVFLFNGKYVSLVGRVLGMRLVYFRPNMTRRVSFELMNRQLVWHGFAEFLLFLMPLINWDRIKTFLIRRFNKPRNVSRLNSSSLSSSSLLSHAMACGICNIEPAYNPYIASCGDIFCYYCIRAGTMADNQFPCNKCGETIVSIKRYSPITPITPASSLLPTTLNSSSSITNDTDQSFMLKP